MGRRPGAAEASVMCSEVASPRRPCPRPRAPGDPWTPTPRLPYATGMAEQFKDRVAVVTGGGSGIGAAMAGAFAARGARLVLADIDVAALERTAGALRGGGTEVLTVRTDVGDPAHVRALADAAVERFGAVHVVCNNAGIALFGPMASATHADWEYTMRVDFWGVVHGVETFVPLLLQQGQGGHIVNTASMAGLVGMQWLGVYCAAKFAVVGDESLHRELKPQGIEVSVLCPMIVRPTSTGTRSQPPQACATPATRSTSRSRAPRCRAS